MDVECVAIKKVQSEPVRVKIGAGGLEPGAITMWTRESLQIAGQFEFQLLVHDQENSD